MRNVAFVIGSLVLAVIVVAGYQQLRPAGSARRQLGRRAARRRQRRARASTAPAALPLPGRRELRAAHVSRDATARSEDRPSAARGRSPRRHDAPPEEQPTGGARRRDGPPPLGG